MNLRRICIWVVSGKQKNTQTSTKLNIYTGRIEDTAHLNIKFKNSMEFLSKWKIYMYIKCESDSDVKVSFFLCVGFPLISIFGFTTLMKR